MRSWADAGGQTEKKGWGGELKREKKEGEGFSLLEVWSDAKRGRERKGVELPEILGHTHACPKS